MSLILLNETQQEIRRLARDYAQRELVPMAAERDREARFDRSMVQQMAELGFFGMLIPEQYDGLGLDAQSYLLALEEIAVGDSSAAVLLSVHNSLPTQMILNFGNEEQRTRFLPPMARGELLGAFCLSEPEAGSDAGSLATQAVREGDEWVLNGTKAWVSHGNEAGVLLCMARTDAPGARKGSKGISTFILTPDLPGFHLTKKENKLGLRASPTLQIVLDNCRVPADRLVGEEGRGLTYALGSLDHGRLGIASQAIGIARAALEASARYAGERKQFGKSIGEFQAIQFKLADMATRITAARTLLHTAAAAKERGEKVTRYSSMAKLFATETAMWVTTQAVQIFGGYGYVTDYPVERYMRDAKVTEIYEGTSEIQRIVIARETLAAAIANDGSLPD
ncbi:MAG TPA: acyl-CoA dehydrogenase [Gemmatimonas aurantiaca]|uniref:Cyclohex-1-ene-1-carbonyl-CoA dehydrogenase n=2 Tax=Gemmatimonas aurantiaca TaxID=173480 RepID=C1A7X4_GEMAT|nr:acyl-CoA dehydrogenase [Gemmatimonas aurantiaca]BAH38334.1 acyl-CoA dehydrogenase [Gemmatimonas aurantiaca T-27]HCT57105.1 acyl-CoA dehydrogenase [Gemmatimonas aurantiaca]